MATATDEMSTSGQGPSCGMASRHEVGAGDHREARRRAVLWGEIWMLVLLGLYFGIVSLANSAAHAVSELLRLWYWMVPLVAGFGLQTGLFVYARRVARLRAERVPGRGVALSGGATTASMVACCAHHLVDILPLLGLAGAALFLTDYQGIFLLLGVLSNALGLLYLLGRIRKHRLHPERTGALAALMRLPLERMLPYAAVTAVVLLAGAAWKWYL